MKIITMETEYVGLSNAVLLVQNNQVVALNVNEEKIGLIDNRKP